MADFPPNLLIRPLTIEDLDQCVALEARGFPESERASRQKLEYRLTVCPELCLGLFVRDYSAKYSAINLPEVAARQQKERDAAGPGADDDADDDADELLPLASSVLRETLIGHIVATKIHAERITEPSMLLPSPDDPDAGHIEHSQYIGIHGLVVDPEWQGKNLGTLLMHDYIQKLSNQDVGDKVAIIAHKELIPFYEKIGFNNNGVSDCKFAGATWYDLSIDLVPEEDD